MVREFQVPFNVVYIKSHEAAIDLNFNIISEDLNSGLIIFRIGTSLTSWGERFKIVITSNNKNSTKVEVASESAFRIQLIDWGKNNENIEIFFDKLSEFLNA